MKRNEALKLLDEVTPDQAGLVTAAQATARGIDRVTQLRLCQVGLLESVGRGVYRVAGAAPPPHLESRVAWLRLDPIKPAWERTGLGNDDGVISHRSACVLHELGDLPAPETELTVPRRRTTREPGVRLHISQLEPTDVTLISGLPVTTVERTVVDLLRARVDGGHVGGVIADAEQRNLVNLGSLAKRVAGFATKYGLAEPSGPALLRALVEQAGRRLAHDNVQQIEDLAKLVGAVKGYQLAAPNSLAIEALSAILANPAFSANIPKVTGSWVSPSVLEAFQKSALSPALVQTIRTLSSQMTEPPAALEKFWKMAAAAPPRIAPFATKPRKPRETKASTAKSDDGATETPQDRGGQP